MGQMIPSPSWLVAEVGGAAILVTNQWVVSLHGDSAVHCFAALVKYRNAVATELAATVHGELQTPVVENTGPLRDLVMRREKESRFRNNVKNSGWMLGGAVIGFMLGTLGTLGSVLIRRLIQ